MTLSLGHLKRALVVSIGNRTLAQEDNSSRGPSHQQEKEQSQGEFISSYSAFCLFFNYIFFFILFFFLFSNLLITLKLCTSVCCIIGHTPCCPGNC